MMMMTTTTTAVDKERSMPEVDLNCRENVSLNSDSDEYSDDETIENKVFPQQRFSPVTSLMHPAALRPRPVRFGAAKDVAVVTTTPVVRPSACTPAFHPHGDVFKAHAAQSQNSSGKLDLCHTVLCSFIEWHF